jgi:DNA-binding transcriptional ArsR family regulator
MVDDAELDELLRALAHPARRSIVSRCLGEWVPAGTLVDELGLAPATVSEHLKVLRKTGLIELQVDGTWRRYRSLPDRLDASLAALTSSMYTKGTTLR